MKTKPKQAENLLVEGAKNIGTGLTVFGVIAALIGGMFLLVGGVIWIFENAPEDVLKGIGIAAAVIAFLTFCFFMGADMRREDS